MPFCVGLTGGIASGKSSAAALFQKLGAAIVDTDVIAHELTRPGAAAMAGIRSAFGPGFVAADGSLERAKMRRLVFNDPDAKAKLEGILHPLIREHARARIIAAQQPYVIVVVPLLIETGAYRDLIQRVVVVDCNEELQVARAMQRSQLGEREVRAILAAQLPRAERLKRADDVIDNSGDIEALRRQIEKLHTRYLTLAKTAAHKRNSTPE